MHASARPHRVKRSPIPPRIRREASPALEVPVGTHGAHALDRVGLAAEYLSLAAEYHRCAGQGEQLDDRVIHGDWNLLRPADLTRVTSVHLPAIPQSTDAPLTDLNVASDFGGEAYCHPAQAAFE